MIQDLSTVHHPVSQLFEAAWSQSDWEQYLLSQEQIEFFGENGYLAGIRVLTEAQVDAIAQEVDAVMDPGHPGNSLFHQFYSNESTDKSRVLFHALGAWRIEPGLHDLLWNPAFLVPAMQLLGGPVRFWHDQLFCKPAKHGGVVAWHQDYSYWTRTQPLSHLTCWIGFDDSTIDNGCVYYVPGSHRWPLLPITGLAGDMEEIRTVLTEDQRAAFRPVPVPLRRGECSFHHALTIHGSYANTTDRPRRAAVINVFRDGVISASEKELLAGVPVVPPGRKLEGQFFPLLARRKGCPAVRARGVFDGETATGSAFGQLLRKLGPGQTESGGVRSQSGRTRI